jgi:hypothetical protein
MDLHPAVVDRLARLAPDQRAAATAPPGPILCVAPAGSGKADDNMHFQFRRQSA